MSEIRTSSDICDEIVLRAWEDDEDVQGQILNELAPAIMSSIAQRFPTLSEVDVEDVVCQAILDFWSYRHQYDSNRPLRPYLYRIAENQANLLVSSRLKWQKAKKLECQVDPPALHEFPAGSMIEDELDELERSKPDLIIELGKIIENLSSPQREIIQAYAQAGDYELDAGDLGVEFGEKFNNGVPYPAGTIRTNKSRAKATIEKEMRKKGFDISTLGIKQ